jgi:hypothetical protein
MFEPEQMEWPAHAKPSCRRRQTMSAIEAVYELVDKWTPRAAHEAPGRMLYRHRGVAQ